jgi:hypothetical protein
MLANKVKQHIWGGNVLMHRVVEVKKGREELKFEKIYLIKYKKEEK